MQTFHFALLNSYAGLSLEAEGVACFWCEQHKLFFSFFSVFRVFSERNWEVMVLFAAGFLFCTLTPPHTAVTPSLLR